MQQLNILCWNARGLRANGDELQHLLQTMAELPLVICVQETMLKTGKTFNIKHYITIRNDNINNIASNGIAVFIRNDIKHKLHNTANNLQIIKIEINFQNEVIDIINVYNPTRTLTNIAQLHHLINRNNKTIVCGDFNAHNAMWYSQYNDNVGTQLEQLIDDCNLYMLNDATPTRYGTNGNASVIDLVFVSQQINTRAHLTVLPYNCGSDHRILHITVNSTTRRRPQHNNNNINNLRNKPLRKYNMKSVDWQRFKNDCSNNFNTHNINSNSIIDFNEQLTHIMNRHIPPINQKPIEKRAVWWNEECETAIRKRRAAEQKLISYPSDINLINFQKARAYARRIIKYTKQQSWHRHCQQFNTSTNFSKIWKTVHAFTKNSNKPFKQNIELNINNNITSEPDEIITALKQTFFTQNNLQPHDTLQLDSEKYYNTPDTKEMHHINLPFNIHELRNALSQSHESTPGQDNINYTTLQHLPNESLTLLLHQINNIWRTGNIPTQWKHAVIIPLLKPTQDPLQASSYRPIALTSCVGKTMERMVNNRLKYYLEQNNLIPDTQCAFRKNRSCTDHLTRLSDDIHKSINRRHKVTAIFIDLHKAFDRLEPLILLQKLKHLNITGNMFNYIYNFLTNRTASIKVNNHFSDTFNLYSGTPQGAILSTTLFLLLLSDIPKLTHKNIRISIFADDIAIWCFHKSLTLITYILQYYLDILITWCHDNRLIISTHKTSAVVFARQFNNTYTPPRLFIDNHLIEVKNTARFLGLIYDRHLNFKNHIDYIKGKCDRYINILRYLTGTTFGSNYKTLKALYKALIISTINYGSEAYHTITPNINKTIQSIQTKALRICTATLKSTPNIALLAECQEPPIDLQRLGRLLLYTSKIKLTDKHVARSIITNKLSTNITIQLANSTHSKITTFHRQHNYTPPTQHETSTPPWLMQQATCNDYITKITNKTNSITIRKYYCTQLINETINTHLHLYTDASKHKETGTVGIACYLPHVNQSIRFRLTDNISIYAAELTALHTAIIYLQTHDIPNKPIIIFTDSLSALTSIRNQKSKSNPILLANTLTAIHRLKQSKKTRIQICYVASHVGIVGNEMADQQANAARLLPSITMSVSPELGDVKRHVRQHITRLWYAQYEQHSDTGRAYKSIRPTLDTPLPKIPGQRALQTIMYRLRTGHCLTTEYMYKYNIDNKQDDLCPSCHNKSEDICHMLFDATCKKFTTERLIYLNKLTTMNIQPILSNVLNNSKSLSITAKFIHKTYKRI